MLPTLFSSLFCSLLQRPSPRNDFKCRHAVFCTQGFNGNRTYLHEIPEFDPILVYVYLLLFSSIFMNSWHSPLWIFKTAPFPRPPAYFKHKCIFHGNPPSCNHFPPPQDGVSRQARRPSSTPSWPTPGRRANLALKPSPLGFSRL